MTLGQILTNHTYIFILTMLRYAGIFLITPIFSSKAILSRVKIGLSFLFAFITIPIILETQKVKMPEHVLLILADVLKELSIGFIMGFIVLLIFSAIQLAGQYIDMRMAFRLANVVNPLSGASTPVVGQFKNIMAILVFLVIDGHHVLIYNIYKSFKSIPLGQTAYINELFKFIFRASGDMFILSFKIALPIVGTIFLVDVILGFLARAVPQMNLFIIGLPVKILVGFVFLILSLNITLHLFTDIFNNVFNDLIKILQILAGG